MMNPIGLFGWGRPPEQLEVLFASSYSIKCQPIDLFIYTMFKQCLDDAVLMVHVFRMKKYDFSSTNFVRFELFYDDKKGLSILLSNS